MMDVDKLIDHAEAYGEGMKQGKEMAIKNYDKLFLELYQKMQDIENKIDSFIYGLEKFTKKKKDILSTKNKVKPVILDNNPISIAKYAEEYPENWEKISNAKSTFSAPKKVYLEDAEEFEKQSKTYRKVLEHRRNCKRWGKEFCLNCFGGGLTKFSSDLEHEYKNQTKEALNSQETKSNTPLKQSSSDSSPDTHFQIKKEKTNDN